MPILWTRLSNRGIFSQAVESRIHLEIGQQGRSHPQRHVERFKRLVGITEARVNDRELIGRQPSFFFEALQFVERFHRRRAVAHGGIDVAHRRDGVRPAVLEAARLFKFGNGLRVHFLLFVGKPESPVRS
jgi:hypothetical protein